ncbi:MAG: hypothetical protein EAZ89_06690 [Bacteroidetes bacterium]|nr:MAG: hypothetical protein EAZ89_06690 [Bacteroidota bacterium]
MNTFLSKQSCLLTLLALLSLSFSGCTQNKELVCRNCAVSTDKKVLLSFVNDSAFVDASIWTDPLTSEFDVLSLTARADVMDTVAAHTLDVWLADGNKDSVQAFILYFTYDEKQTSAIDIQSLDGLSVYRSHTFSMTHTFYQKSPDGMWAEIPELSGYVSSFLSEHFNDILTQVLHLDSGRRAYLMVINETYKKPALQSLDQVSGKIDAYIMR